MDILTFIATLVRALAWPVTVIILVIILRKPLFQLIPLIRSLRYGGVEIDFDTQVYELALRLQKQLPPAFKVDTQMDRAQQNLERLAQLSPRGAVLEAWLLMEEAAIEASKRHNLPLKSRELRSPILLGQYLVEAGILDEEQEEIFHRLRNLRNAAAHAFAFEIDPTAAVEYIRLAIQLAELIRLA